MKAPSIVRALLVCALHAHAPNAIARDTPHMALLNPIYSPVNAYLVALAFVRVAYSQYTSGFYLIDRP